MREQRLQHFLLERRVQLEQILQLRRGRRREVALGAVENLEERRLEHAILQPPFQQAGADLVHMLVVFHQAGDEDRHVVERQLADQRGDEVDKFAVGFLAVLDDALQQRPQRLVFLFQRRALGLGLRHPQRQVKPFALDFFHRSQSDRVVLRQ